MRAATPALVRPLWRSRLSWPLRVWMIDSMIWRRGRRNLAPGRGASDRVAGRSTVMPTSLRSASKPLSVMRVWPALAAGAVALVGDEGLARSGDPGRVDHVCADFALVGFRAGDRERDRQSRGCGDKVQPQAPEVPRMRRAVAVLGPSREAGALLGLAAASALDRRGVHQPHVVVPRLALACEASHDTCDHRGAAPQPLVVAVAVGQIREPRPKMRMGVAHELRLVVIAQQRRDHRQGDQLRVRQLRSELHHRPLRRPPRVLRQQVINPHIQCGREGDPSPGPC